MRNWEPSYHSNQNNRRKLVKYGLIAAAVITVFLIAFYVLAKDDDTASERSVKEPEQAQPDEYSRVKGKYIFSGTIVLGRAVEKAALNADGTYDNAQPFSGLSQLNYNQYDAGVIDLECPSTGRRVSYEESVANLVFDCHPDWFSELGKYYQIMNIAGNHTYDAGADGFQKTVANIQDSGLQAVGHYSPREKDDICEVVALPARLQKTDGGEEEGTLPMAFCSYHYQFEFQPQPGELETIKEYSKIMPVVGLMHAGAEYQPKASIQQQQYAKRMIDNGAEFVIGNGAHWVQDTEVYKDKLIVYSTGNFIFDQIEYETRLGLSIAASMTADYDKNIAGWLKLGKNCAARDDKCFETAKNKGLKRYSPKFEFDAVSTFGGYQRVTEKASPEQEQDILERANWKETLEELGQTQ